MWSLTRIPQLLLWSSNRMQSLLQSKNLTPRCLIIAPTGSLNVIITGRTAELSLRIETEAAGEMTASKDPVRKKPKDSQQDEVEPLIPALFFMKNTRSDRRYSSHLRALIPQHYGVS